MMKRLIGIFVFLIVVLVVVFWTIKIAGKPQTVSVTTSPVQVQDPDPAPTPEPKPVVEVSKPEKPVLTVEDPGGRLLVDDGFWPGFRIDPDGRGFFSAFRNMPRGTSVYAPDDGYIIRVTGDGQPGLAFIPGSVPTLRNYSQREDGVWIYNLASNIQDYEFLKKGDLLGATRQDSLTFFLKFDKTINFGFDAGIRLTKALSNTTRPTDQRKLLLLMIQESKKLNK